MTVEVLAYGPDAVLVITVPALVLRIAEAVRAHLATHGGDHVDVVPAACSVLVRQRNLGRADSTRLAIGEVARRAVTGDCTAPQSTSLVELPVVYDGDDLDVVARFADATVAEVVAWHQGTPYRVAFCGFAPGFAYLVGGDPRLQIPRRATPRPRVPAGSVAVGGGYCGIYPRSSPGGWHLLGRTEVMLWDPSRRPPAMLVPGTTVKFTAVGG